MMALYQSRWRGSLSRVGFWQKIELDITTTVGVAGVVLRLAPWARSASTRRNRIFARPEPMLKRVKGLWLKQRRFLVTWFWSLCPNFSYLVFVLVPPPQTLLHVPKSDQVPQPPLTARRNRIFWYIRRFPHYRNKECCSWWLGLMTQNIELLHTKVPDCCRSVYSSVFPLHKLHCSCLLWTKDSILHPPLQLNSSSF